MTERGDSNNLDTAEDGAGGAMPSSVRLVIFGVVVPLLLGAIYLIAVRGHALLLDLDSSIGIWCF